MHTSVFITEAIRELNVTPGGNYIDATFGEGGHSKAIVQAGGMVLGIEADELQHQKHVLGDIPVIHANFKDIEKVAHEHNFYPVHGILFDLGLSMEQLGKSRRGFSFKKAEEPLDMRIGDTDITAAEIVQKTSEEELKTVLVKYSEDPIAEHIAEEIVRTRGKREMQTVGDLTAVIRKVLAQKNITGEQSIDKTNARIFQALRIYVNDEFEALRQALYSSLQLLVPGGRIVVITFHSLEDRIVKLFARERSQEIKHVRVEVDHERSLQKFERSAQLRVLEKTK